MKTIKLKLDSFKGWFWFCPIYWNTTTKELKPRYKLGFVLDFALWLHHSMLLISSFLCMDIESSYPIKITDVRFK